MSHVAELVNRTYPGIRRPLSQPRRGPGPGHRNRAVAGLLVGMALLTHLAGCATPASPPPDDVTSSPPPQVAPSPHVPLALAPGDRAAARRTAREALNAYARPGLSARAWWAGLRPYLSADAQLAYAGTDPGNIPATVVSGRARLTPASSPALARVAVLTSTGSYLLLLTRSVHRWDWLVTRIVAPEQPA